MLKSPNTKLTHNHGPRTVKKPGKCIEFVECVLAESVCVCVFWAGCHTYSSRLRPPLSLSVLSQPICPAPRAHPLAGLKAEAYCVGRCVSRGGGRKKGKRKRKSEPAFPSVAKAFAFRFSLLLLLLSWPEETKKEEMKFIRLDFRCPRH